MLIKKNKKNKIQKLLNNNKPLERKEKKKLKYCKKKCVIKIRCLKKKTKSKKSTGLLKGIIFPLPRISKVNLYTHCSINSKTNSYFLLDSFLDNLTRSKFTHEYKIRKYAHTLEQTNFLLKRNAKDVSAYCKKFIDKPFIDAKKYPPEVYCERTNYENYANSPNTNIIIFGKPDPSHGAIANAIAKNLRYTHISPVDVMNKAISQSTFIGKWIYSNLSLNKKIPIEVILKLIAIEICNEKRKYIPFVLSGLPIIPDNYNAPLGPDVIKKVEQIETKKIKKTKSSSSHDDLAEENDYDELSEGETEFSIYYGKSGDEPEADTVSVYEEDIKENFFEEEELLAIDSPNYKQLNTLFKTYISNAKYVRETLEESVKRQFDFLNKLDINVAIYLYNTDSDLLIKRTKEEALASVVAQIKNTHKVIEVLEEYYGQFSKSHGFQIDTRFSNVEICNRIMKRLLFLPIKEIYYPDLVFKNLKIPDHLHNIFIDNKYEENFDILCRTDVIKPLLFWRKSEFRFYCPIERYYGKLTRGKLNLAIRYLSKLILCSSLERLKEFTKYTEKYMYSQPTCRVAILGARKTGKSLLSKILSTIQQEPIFDYEKEQYDIYQDRIFFVPEIFDSHYKEASKLAYNETKDIYLELEKLYDKIKHDFTREIFDNVISLIYEIIGSTTKKVDQSQFTHLIDEYLPNECFRDFRKVRVSDPLFLFCFYERYKELNNEFFNNTNNIINRFLNFEKRAYNNRLSTFNSDENCYSQWIIDDAPLTINFWKSLGIRRNLPDVFIIFENYNEDVIVEILLHYFKSFFNIGTAINNYLLTDFHWFNKERILDEFKNIVTEKNKRKQAELNIFIKYLAKNKFIDFDKYQKEINNLKVYLENKNVEIITVDCSQKFGKGKDIYKMFEYILFQYFTIFTSIPKVIEFNDHFKKTYESFETDIVSTTASVFSKKSFIKMSKSQLSVGTSPLKNTILNELDLGATCDYCPVSLVNKNILVKGNMNYCVEYCNKYMVLDSQENLDQFLIEPQKYYFEHKIPQVPPPRICFLGPNSKAKIQFAKALGEILEVPVYFSNKEWKPNMQSFQSRLELDFLDYKSEFSIQEIMKEKTTYSTGFILCGYSFDRKSTIEKAEYYPEAVFVFDEEDNLTRILNKHGPLERSNSIISRTDVKQLDDTFTQNYRYKSVESLNESVSYKRKNSRLRAKQVIELILQSIEEDIKFYKQLDYPIINIPSSFIDPLVVQKIISKYAKAINNNTDRATLFYVPRRIDLDTALKCVDCGYYRKSRFGLSCPVRIKKMQLFNNFYGLQSQHKIFPCIVNEFIYFISTRQNLKEFMVAPQNFTNQCHTNDYPKALMIAVVGPMFSGISALVDRICKEYKMKAIVEYDVFNFIITIIRHSQLYKSLKDNKFKLTQQLFFSGLSLLKNHYKTGIVINNYLLTPDILKLALHTNCEINIVFVLQQNFKVGVQKFLQLNLPSSLEELCIHYENFMDMVRIFKTCRDICYFNIHYVLDTKNNWTIWNEVQLVIFRTVRNHISYTKKLEYPLLTNLAYLNTFYEEVEQGLDKIDLNCPVCYSNGLFIRYRYDNYNVNQRFYERSCQLELTKPYGFQKDWLYEVYKFSKPFSWQDELPPIITDNHLRNNICQFKDYFLWTCDLHTIEMLVHPDDFIPVSEENVPKYVPFLISNYPLLMVTNDGYCIVSYEKGIKAIDNLLSVDVSLAMSHLRHGTTSMYCKARRVPVPDERFDFLCEHHKPLSKVPAYLNVVDIAGLVKGASEGQGLGNAFLSHISACDAIFHLCRVFEDTNVTHIEGEVDPVRDLDIITEELRLKDEEKLLQNLEKLEKTYVRGGDKKLKQEYDSMIKIKQLLMDEKKCLRFSDWNAHDIEALNKHLFLTSKPVIYLVNLSEKDFIRKKNKWLIKIKEWVDKNDPGATIIPFSGAFESQLMEMDDAERKAYEEEHKCKSNLDKIIIQGYKALQLEYFFTAGHDEVKAWTILKGTKAPQAAGRIHTDFEKGFIMAEVMHYKDFKEEGSEASCKSAGKYRQQGRNYGVEDGDIIFFKFNAGAGLKDPKKK